MVAHYTQLKRLKDLTAAMDRKLLKELGTPSVELVFIKNPTCFVAETFSTIEIVVMVGAVDDNWPNHIFTLEEIFTAEEAMRLWDQHGEIVGKVLKDRRIDSIKHRRIDASTR